MNDILGEVGSFVYHLKNISNQTDPDPIHPNEKPVELLSLFIVIMTSLSIVSVVLAFITYSLYSNLRSISGTSLLNLLTALFLSHLLSVVGVEGIEDKEICLTLAVLLQYLWSSVHFWLAAMTFDMYRTFRDNINLQTAVATEERKPFLRCILFAWGTPGVLTTLGAFFHLQTDNRFKAPIPPTCWIVDQYVVVFTFVLPAVLLAIFDVYMFIRSGVLIQFTANLQMNRRTRDKMRKHRVVQLLLYVKLLVLFLSNWVFCTIALFTNNFVIWYAFALMTALQGFFVALGYACNSHVFRLYRKSVRRKKKAKLPGYSSFELSHSASLALLSWQPSPDAV